MANVIFKTGTSAQYNALTERPTTTLYWLTDTKEIRKGDDLYGVGRLASTELAGLMSPADKQNLDRLVEIGKHPIIVPEFSIERQGTAEDGYAVSYKLKRTYGNEVSYVGDVINIPRDLVLEGAFLKNVTVNGEPYEGAQVGDPYLDLVFNDANNSHIYVPVKGLVDTYVAGNGINVTDYTISIKVDGTNANGLVAIGNGLGLNLATCTSAGAMSSIDKLVLESLPMAYEKVAYELAYKPEGTLVDYRDKEVRIMCPNDTEWSLQTSGDGAGTNSYYVGFKAYAPSNEVVSFKEDLAEIISDTTMYYFEGNQFAGVDEFGRKYSIVWLPVAKYDAILGTWTYHGSKSNEEKYIGWYYSVEWYNAAGKAVKADTIRINLSNEDCHTQTKPYYYGKLATNEDLGEIQETISELEHSFTWGEM